ncbi:protease inhibitor I42 family protein [Streptomyces sp. NPDC007905]|uniref:protease inhibitor I42 family protein n=1 Tax=Streptomyces sp. NPDC007905 TaxID=3364788 RepID=UPI0036E95DA0
MRRTTSARLLAASALLPLTLAGCGLLGGDGQAEYGAQQRSIAVDAGERFTLSLPASPALGEHWYLAGPRPDAAVLKYRGKREDVHGSPEGITGGGEGTEYFDFTAVKSGTTQVKMLHCPMARCSSAAEAEASASPVPTATGTPGDVAEYFVYKITVR